MDGDAHGMTMHMPNCGPRAHEGPGSRNSPGALQHEQAGDQACNGCRVNGLGVARMYCPVAQAHGAVLAHALGVGARLLVLGTAAERNGAIFRSILDQPGFRAPVLL